MDGVLVVDKPAGPTSHDVVDRGAAGPRHPAGRATPAPSTRSRPASCPSASAAPRASPASCPGARRSTSRRCASGFATTTDDLTGEPLGEARPADGRGRGARRRPRRPRGLVRPGAARLLGEARGRPAPLRAGPAGRGGAAGGRAGDRARRRPPGAPRATRSRSRCAARPGPTCGPSPATSASGSGPGAHLTALRRTRSGAFDLSQAVTATTWPARRERLLPLAALLLDLPAVTVGAEGRRRVGHGRELGGRTSCRGLPGGAGRAGAGPRRVRGAPGPGRAAGPDPAGPAGLPASRRSTPTSSSAGLRPATPPGGPREDPVEPGPPPPRGRARGRPSCRSARGPARRGRGSGRRGTARWRAPPRGSSCGRSGRRPRGAPRGPAARRTG